MFTRSILITTISFAAVLLAGGCQKSSTMDSTSSADTQSRLDTSAQAVPADINLNSETVVMQVYGMSCPLCSANVDKQLLKIPGVQSVNVNLNTGRVLVQVSKDNPPAQEKLENAITESGFTLVGDPQPQ